MKEGLKEAGADSKREFARLFLPSPARELAAISCPHKLIDYYLGNRAEICEEEFIARYAKLAKGTPVSNFSRIARWYAEKFVMPSVRDFRSENPVIDSQKRVEEGFIRGELVEGCTILDAGCGPGRIPALFHDHPQVEKIYAFDLSREMLEIAGELVGESGAGEKVELFHSDLVELPDMGLRAPVIVTCMFGTLGNIPQECDRMRALRRLQANAHGGKLLLSAYNLEYLESARSYYGEISFGAGGDMREVESSSGEKVFFLFPSTGHFSAWYSEDGLREEIEKAGLEARIEKKGELLLAAIDGPE